MQRLGQSLGACMRVGDVVLLTGEMGAGKSVLTRAAARAMGVDGPVPSPTFTILNIHEGREMKLYHFDLYRLDEQDELEDTGYYDTIDADGVSFIEWGEKFPGALPYSYLEIEIRKDEDNPDGRVVFAHAYGDSSRQLLFLWANDSKSRLVKTVK